MSKTIDALAREHTEEVIARALDIMRDGEKDSDRMAAIKFLAETGHGKPNQAVIALPMTRRMAEQLYGMTKDQLLDIIQPAAMRLPPVDRGDLVVVEPEGAAEADEPKAATAPDPLLA